MLYNFLFFFYFSFHPIYISVLEINSVENNLEIIVKIFRDDLEDGIRYTLDKEVSIDNQDKIELNKELIKNYFEKVLFININKEKKPILFSEFILENDRIKISGKINNNLIIKSFEIYNETLVDIFSLQKNVVFVKIYKEMFNITLDKNNKKTNLIIE